MLRAAAGALVVVVTAGCAAAAHHPATAPPTTPAGSTPPASTTTTTTMRGAPDGTTPPPVTTTAAPGTSPTTSSAARGAPPPGPTPTTASPAPSTLTTAATTPLAINAADEGRSYDVAPGQVIDVTLHTGELWSEPAAGDGSVLRRASGAVDAGSGDATATFSAVGRGTTTITAQHRCRPQPGQVCPQYVATWSVGIIVR